MPFSYKIDEARGVITITMSGRVTGSDVTDYVAVSRNDPAFRPEMRRLVVAAGVDGFPHLPEVREITTHTLAGPPNPTIRIAAVADTPLGRGMIAMFFGHWGLTDKYRLFEDQSAAMAWLLSDKGITE